MTRAFDYSQSPDPVRDDLAEAHRETWAHVAAPGTWLTGTERVAIAAETRAARTCTLCADRKAALSPFSIEGVHESASSGALEDGLIDGVHRVTTDPQRLTRSWFDGLMASGISAERYVETLGVAVLVISIDEFHRALGIPLEPLPAALPGEPSREPPSGVTSGEAWVPMLDLRHASAAERRMVNAPGGKTAYVVRALSLVPREVLAWSELSDAQYIPRREMMNLGKARAIDRSQVELVAARVSSVNECFY